MNVQKQEVESFLDRTKFTGYQAVPLPHGLFTPGQKDHARVDVILAGIQGKTVLDIGTYYGMFPANAVLRGATHALGIEADPERCAIAQKIAALNGDAYQICCGQLGRLSLDRKFDVVLLLNVLHHVTDPIEAISTAASYSKDKLILEFCLPTDTTYIHHCMFGPAARRTLLRRSIAALRSLALQLVAGRLPILAVGNREYHSTYYISKSALYNMFVVHLGLFSHIQFRKSFKGRNRVLAVCDVEQAL